MSTMRHLFVGDLRRITSNVVSVIIVIGLVAIPALFTWFNVAASWDPFSNTKNLKFAVASVDEGYSSDLVPVEITVGDKVIAALRANNQLDWTFTSKDDAIEGTKSGEYYAAVVIPKDFSRDMMTFFSSDKAEHAKLIYYTNQKSNALAPAVTSQGADQVSAQVNQIFAQTITNTALSIASNLIDRLDDADSQAMLSKFNTNVGDFAQQMNDAADLLDTYSALTDTASGLFSSADALIDSASGAMDDAQSALTTAKSGAQDITGSLTTASDALSAALQTSADSYTAVGDSIDSVFASADDSAADVASNVRAQAKAVDGQIAEYQSIRNAVAALPDAPGANGSGSSSSVVSSAATRALKLTLDALDTVITRQTALRDALNTAADNIDAKRDTAKQDRQHVKDLATQAHDAVAGLKTNFNDNVSSKVTAVAKTVGSMTSSLDSGSSKLTSTVDDLQATAKSTDEKLADVHDSLTAAAATLRKTSDKLSNFSDALANALNSGNMSMVRDLLSEDSASLAETLSAPVQLKRKAVFPVANFGSSLSPLYTLLPLWVGALLMSVTLKTTVSRKVRAELAALAGGRQPRPHQLYLGHFGVFAVISLLQSTVLCGGNLLFLHVQSVHPLLYMLAGWASGLVYAFFIYTLVVSFGNVGKAIGVLYLVVQICGSGAAYPLQVLPGFVSVISPFLPITHSVTMLRAAIAGMYMNDYWIAMGKLLLFVPPIVLLGLVLRKPLVGFNRWYVAKVESTKLL
ncbi:phage infection protein [Bifidobacterium goeldii]|uniref:Phage infection protein n=1 Tax=Bifidobacterium goeldii TaxID=2306975 RepID=A0A430FF20_9BIFI|nr:YhgE/Pip domain-containing protein [Bifidobacterium goeldii]RSX51371.1 phage infection protein [Bifidobacterium goeldii]